MRLPPQVADGPSAGAPSTGRSDAFAPEPSLRDGIVEVGRQKARAATSPSNDGNISIRLDDATISTTPKSVSKGFMTPDMMVVIDLDGKKVAANATRRPSC